jgi:hypothetical protein
VLAILATFLAVFVQTPRHEARVNMDPFAVSLLTNVESRLGNENLLVCPRAVLSRLPSSPVATPRIKGFKHELAR